MVEIEESGCGVRRVCLDDCTLRVSRDASTDRNVQLEHSEQIAVGVYKRANKPSSGRRAFGSLPSSPVAFAWYT